MNLDEILIISSDPSYLSSFLSQLFDFEVKLKINKISLELDNTTLIFEAGKKRSSRIDCFRFKIDSIEALLELIQKGNFLIYTLKNSHQVHSANIQIKISEIFTDDQSGESWFEILDFDKRKWIFFTNS